MSGWNGDKHWDTSGSRWDSDGCECDDGGGTLETRRRCCNPWCMRFPHWHFEIINAAYRGGPGTVNAGAGGVYHPQTRQWPHNVWPTPVLPGKTGELHESVSSHAPD